MDKCTKVIDISQYNKIYDYAAVKRNGIGAVIIKAINKSLDKESAFEKHLKGCNEANLQVLGTYHYTYANTVEKAKKAVQAWIKAVDGRCDLYFLDWEDACLPKNSDAVKIINVYAEAIIKAGYKFALYTGLSWYNSYLKKYNMPYDLWIARYYAGYTPFKMSTPVNDKYRPDMDNLMGWQYTSSGQIDGIEGCVDINIWYRDICTNTNIESIPVDHNPYTEPIQNVSLGATGNDANWVLWYLWRFGMLIDTGGAPDARMIDGYLTTGDIFKVKLAQDRLGLKADGIVGIKTKSVWKKIC